MLYCIIYIKNMLWCHTWFFLSVSYFSECVILVSCGCWWFWTCWWNIWNSRFSLYSTEAALKGFYVGVKEGCLRRKLHLGPACHSDTVDQTIWFGRRETSWPSMTPILTGLLVYRPHMSQPAALRTWSVASLVVPESRSRTKCDRAFGIRFPLHRFHGWTKHD